MILKEKTNQQLTDSKTAADVFFSVLNMRQKEDQHKECFYVIGLNSQNTVLYVDLVTIGTVNQCTPTVREVMRLGLVKNAVALIVGHNHPSGHTKPSKEDEDFTKKLVEASQILQIKLLDHLILGAETFYSFSDEGVI